MEPLKVESMLEIPEDYTGVVLYDSRLKHGANGTSAILHFKNGNQHREDGPATDFEDGSKFWYKNGYLHREDGPAKEWSDGHKEWYLEGIHYPKINLKNFVILDHDKGRHGVMWYKLLDKDKVLEHPDIPGLTEK